MLRRAAALGLYAGACSLLHSLLRRHYLAACGASWTSILFGLEPSPYCELVRRGLDALTWSPLGALGLGALATRERLLKAE